MDLELIQFVTHLADFANYCECGCYIPNVNPSELALNALHACLQLGLSGKPFDTPFRVDFTKYGFTRFTVHNGTIELLNDLLMLSLHR